GYPQPWYSVRGVEAPIATEEGHIVCYLRDGERVFLTYSTTGRGNEPADTTLGLLDMTPYGRREAWEDNPAGWAAAPEGGRPRRSGPAPGRLPRRPSAARATTTDVASELETFLIRHVGAGTVPGAVALRG